LQDKKDKMGNNLDDILISFIESPEKTTKTLAGIRSRTALEAMFEIPQKERDIIENILHEVAKKPYQVDDLDSLDGLDNLIEYTKKFDKVELTPDQIRISETDLEEAHNKLDKKLLASIRLAIKNVRKYQEEIFVSKTIPGKVKYTPVERVGICIPGASAPLPSTVIMTAVPAQVAGVKEIAVVSPPRYKGTIHSVILAVCHELKIKEVYRIGGVQAVGALAFGIWEGDDKEHKKIIPEVDKIVGPGNKWVQTAKQIVAGWAVGIDSIAGPSEVLIIADASANPAWVAADMLSQAEHAPGSAITLTDSEALAKKIIEELKKQVDQLDRANETMECLLKSSRVVIFSNMNNMIGCANSLASEHLQIQCGDKSAEIADKINNAGAIFIGNYSPVAVGDYWAGPSHTLPTGSRAEYASALSANDFVKATSIIEYSREQLAESADDIIRLAMTEGLDAHAKSIQIRRDS
jgi:histidinol dehydrogenase